MSVLDREPKAVIWTMIDEMQRESTDAAEDDDAADDVDPMADPAAWGV